MNIERNSSGRVERQCWRFPELDDGTLLLGSNVLHQIQSRIRPDGSVEMVWGETFHPEPIIFSKISSQERRALSLRLARTLYQHVHRTYSACLGSQLDQRWIEQIEPHIALEFAGVRHEPGFLEDVAGIVDEVINFRFVNRRQTPDRQRAEDPYPEVCY